MLFRSRKKRSKKEENSKTDDVLAVEAELRRLLGTKVNIISENNKGKIEIEYYSIDELNRLIDILRDFAK